MHLFWLLYDLTSDRFGLFERVNRVVAESRGACGCVAGWPLLLNGERGSQCAEVENFLAGVMQARAWRSGTGVLRPLPIVLVDERFSTAETVGPMRALGFSARAQQKRKDSAAAAVILQRVLDSPGGEALSRLENLDLSDSPSSSRSSISADDYGDGEDSGTITKAASDYKNRQLKESPEASRVVDSRGNARVACNDTELMEWLSHSIDSK